MSGWRNKRKTSIFLGNGVHCQCFYCTYHLPAVLVHDTVRVCAISGHAKDLQMGDTTGTTSGGGISERGGLVNERLDGGGKGQG